VKKSFARGLKLWLTWKLTGGELTVKMVESENKGKGRSVFQLDSCSVFQSGNGKYRGVLLLRQAQGHDDDSIGVFSESENKGKGRSVFQLDSCSVFQSGNGKYRGVLPLRQAQGHDDDSIGVFLESENKGKGRSVFS
jgi:hypothetical protein